MLFNYLCDYTILMNVFSFHDLLTYRRLSKGCRSNFNTIIESWCRRYIDDSEKYVNLLISNTRLYQSSIDLYINKLNCYAPSNNYSHSELWKIVAVAIPRKGHIALVEIIKQNDPLLLKIVLSTQFVSVGTSMITDYQLMHPILSLNRSEIYEIVLRHLEEHGLLDTIYISEILLNHCQSEGIFRLSYEYGMIGRQFEWSLSPKFLDIALEYHTGKKRSKDPRVLRSVPHQPLSYYSRSYRHAKVLWKHGLIPQQINDNYDPITAIISIPALLFWWSKIGLFRLSAIDRINIYLFFWHIILCPIILGILYMRSLSFCLIGAFFMHCLPFLLLCIVPSTIANLRFTIKVSIIATLIWTIVCIVIL